LEVKFIDMHAHLIPGDEARHQLLGLMDKIGIERTVIVAGGSISPELLARQILEGGGSDLEIDNTSVYEHSRCSERLIPFYFANPHGGDVLYRREGAKFRGLKLGPVIHGVPFNDERTVSLISAARDFKHPVYFHCLARTGFRVKDVLPLAKKFPAVQFILGHAGIGNADFSAAPEIEPYSNLFFEASGGFTGVVKAAVRVLGCHRVLFGSEFPLQDPRVEIEKFRCLDLRDEEFGQVMRCNAQKILGEGAHA
jgi:uncharacterized protein